MQYIKSAFSNLWQAGVTVISFLAGQYHGRDCSQVDETKKSVLYQESENKFGLNLQKQYQEFLNENTKDNFECCILSGGGSHGAYGTGFLAGWRKSGNMPKFRLVTGISTGALQATWAFLGEDRDYEQMIKLYTKVTTKDIYRPRQIKDGHINSAYITEGLTELIKNNITIDIIERVAIEAKKGRKLYVGSSNLDTGTFHVWDLTELAIDDNLTMEAKRERYCLILKASAAIPIVFPPVIIDGHMHVDGGTVANVFLYERMLNIKQGKNNDRMVVNVIVNGYRGLYTTCVRNDLLDIASRSLKVLFNANEESDLRIAEYLSSNHKLNFRITNLPDDFYTKMTSMDFIPDEMQKMYVRGFDEGFSKSWGRT